MSASEAALYENMSTLIDPHEPCTVELLRMLARQPRKAALVRSCYMTFCRDLDVIFARRKFGRSPPAPDVLSLYRDVLVRMVNLSTLRVPMPTGRHTFYGDILQIIRSGVFKLKSLLIPGEASGGFAALDEAVASHAGTLRSIGFMYSRIGTLTGDRLNSLTHFADRYSTFAVSDYVDSSQSALSSGPAVYLYPILDALSPVCDTDLYMRNIQHALWNRDETTSPWIVITCLQQLHFVIPRVLQHLAASFSDVTSLTIQLISPASTVTDDHVRARDTDSFSAWVAIIASLAAVERSLTILVLASLLNEGQSDELFLNEDEERELLRHIATRCRSVRIVTLPTGDEYYLDSAAKDGWSVM
ncbi:hypothetical protein EXIGLDRAFT_764986 [Exidia glandulosa HHB12029]|uniref:Uncharacterized protein n=1 Tax=Exidia glandulosa HHB12029 TaxID=1314781 RepID=A0A165KUH9_EXIGL|nr:hypothetical protein EXIGLDRAFT_764986 [Exidia glandulosa HHB12029]